MKRGTLAALMIGLFVAACASAGSGGTPMFRREVGTASAPDALNLGLRVVQQYAYEVFSVDTVSEIRILTHWKPRRTFEDETAVGATAAESRLLIVARPRGQTEMGAFYVVNLTVENRLRVAANPAWNETLNTRMFLQYANEVAQEYRRQITNIGVRRY